MTIARSQQISLEETPYYHCVSRCVRRAFLCGEQYEHRRQWVEDKLLSLAQVFCIDVAAYAVMSNHYHVVLYVDKAEADALTDLQVVERWHQLYKGNLFSQRMLKGQSLSYLDKQILKPLINTWRQRLCNISWLMKNLNEHIAREANKEDECTGRFWEGRFKSQALLDERAIAACMAYVDLNPIRAKAAGTPEQSEHTSIKRRCKKARSVTQANHPNQQEKSLLPFVGNPRQAMPKGLPFKLTDYLELVDWSGRILREDKLGSIDSNIPPVLERLNLSEDNWEVLIKSFEKQCKSFAGSENLIKRVYRKLGYQRTPARRLSAVFS
jgi:REP element-mobilizing transposase RayT